MLLIGDVRQHQGVDAGKPFEQLQESGMRSAVLDRIVRQRDPELLKAVEHLSKNETATGVRMLQEQGRVTEIRRRRATHRDHREGVCGTAREHDHRLAGQRIATRSQSSGAARVAGGRNVGEGGSFHPCSHSSFGHDGRGSSMGGTL